MGSKTLLGDDAELSESRDDDAEYVIRTPAITIKFSQVEWAGGSWKLLNDDVEVAILLDGTVDGLRDIHGEQQ